MIKLTKHQLSDIQDLVDNPLVKQASVDFHSNGLMKVTIISKTNADKRQIDTILEQIFPGMEYRGTPAVTDDGEYHFIDWNGETLIHLCIKKTKNLRKEG